MALTIKYTKGQYLAKLTELENYYSQLDTHLTRLKELKDQMYNFWDDSNAQKTGLILSQQIRYVQTTMDHVNYAITLYKSTVEKLDGANLNVGDILDTVLSLLK